MVGTENLNGDRHVVQFYGRDEELAERVTGYLLGALDSGGVAIVIATPEHRGEFETRLGRAGVDLAAARDDGSYLALDAGQTLAELMTADTLDPAAFDRVIGTLIRRAGAAGRSAPSARWSRCSGTTGWSTPRCSSRRCGRNCAAGTPSPCSAATGPTR